MRYDHHLLELRHIGCTGTTCATSHHFHHRIHIHATRAAGGATHAAHAAHAAHHPITVLLHDFNENACSCVRVNPFAES